MREAAREVLRGAPAWVVGGAVRDELLGREVTDLDIACGRPKSAARAYARRTGGAVFPLSIRHGAWRVVLEGHRTVDFAPLQGDSIEEDLSTRDFTINAIALPLEGGEPIDPYEGRADVAAGVVRPLSTRVFDDDPLRLLRAVRHEDELGFRLDPGGERLVRERAALVAEPARERVVEELLRLSADGLERLDELGLLEPLGGRLDPRLRAFDGRWYRLALVFGAGLKRFPVPVRVRRFVDVLLRAEAPPDDSARSIHRFRRATEPWAVEALAYVGRNDLAAAVREARATAPAEPLLRGNELGIPPGPEVGRLLELIAEERAAGTISTREEALDLVRRSLE